MPTFTDNSAKEMTVNGKKAYGLAISAISSYKRPVTISEIQLKTGLSVFDTEDALSVITEKYVCSLEVNDKGEIVYNFGNLVLRNPEDVSNLAKKIFKVTLHALEFIAKLVITVVFFSYAFTFGVAVGLLISLLAKSPQPIFILFISIYEAIKMLFLDMKSFFTDTPIDKDVEEKNLVAMTYAYAFNKIKPEDELKKEKEIAEYIQLNSGIISATDLILITGWTYSKCNEELTYLLTHFGGIPEVSDNGVILYNFPSLNKPIENKAGKKRSDYFTWDNLVEKIPYNQNTKTANNTIGFVAWFSIVVSALLFFFWAGNYNIWFGNYVEILSFQLGSKLGVSETDAKGIYITFWLFAFFTTFLISSRVSRFKVRKANNLLDKFRIRQQSLKYIFSNMPIVPHEKMPQKSEDEQFTFANKYRGETQVNENTANIEYNFNFIQSELSDAETIRGKSYGYEFPSSPEGKLSVAKKSKTGTVILLCIILVFISSYYIQNYTQYNVKSLSFSSFFSKQLIIDFRSDSFQQDIVEITDFKGELIFINGELGDEVPNEISKIRHIVFKNCKFPINMPKKAYIEKLEFRNCQIDTLLNMNLSYVEELTIDSCNITKLPFKPSFDYRLRSVYLTNNKLKTIPAGLFICRDLRMFDFTNNEIEQLPDSLDPIGSFSDFVFKGNKIKELPTSFWLYQIQTIDLSENPIKKFPKFQPINENKVGLSSISAAGCQLTELPEFWKLRFPDRFDFSNNEISKFPNEMCDDSNFGSTLLVSSNKITEIPACLATNKRLRELDISKNPLSSFPSEFESHKKKIEITISKDLPQDIKNKIIKTVSITSVKYAKE